jgi:hypothetical protein
MITLLMNWIITTLNFVRILGSELEQKFPAPKFTSVTFF